MKFATMFALVASSSFGCGSSSSSDDSSKPTIAGTFKSDCVPLNSGGIIYSLVNTDSASRAESTIYSDKSCLTALMVTTGTRAYTVGNAVANLTNAYEIDFTYSKVETTFKNEAAVAEANGLKSYGMDGWQLSVTRDVTGKKYNDSATAQPSSGQVAYLIYKIDGTDYYGADNSSVDGSTKEKRPTSLLTSFKLKKQ